MVAKISKSSSPMVATDHPALQLSIVLGEQAENLAKLQPIYLANDQIQDDHTIHAVRNSYEYVYVMHWITHCRGFIKMESEYFDIDLFEIELLNMVYPPPLNDLVLFIHKLKRLLINALPGKNIDSFERVFHLWFQSNAQRQHEDQRQEEDSVNSLEDEKNEESYMEIDDQEDVVLPPFDNLLFEEKIRTLYVWMVYLTSFSSFRTYLDKKGLHPDELRMNPIWSREVSDNTSEEWLLLFHSSRLYSRIVTQPELKIPKKRKLAPEDPGEHFGDIAFDVAEIKYELLAKGIYQINALVEKLATQKKQKESKDKYKALNDKESLEHLFNSEIKKRRLLASRKKDIQMSNLLATRKRSSRIEAKEKERLEEEQRKKEHLEELKVLEAQRRMERRMAVRNDTQAAPGLTRQDRARLRRENLVESPSSEEATIQKLPITEEIKNEEVERDTKHVVEHVVEQVKEGLNSQDQITHKVQQATYAQEHESPVGNTTSTAEVVPQPELSTIEPEQDANTQKASENAVPETVIFEEKFNTVNSMETTVPQETSDISH